MEKASVVFTTCVIIACILPLTESLFCYQCGSAGKDGFCKTDIKGLTKSANKVLKNLANISDEVSDNSDDAWSEEGVTVPNVKYCSATRTTCLIEEVQNSQTGGVLSYIRDCSDGKSFSFENMTMLKDVVTNNFTTCAYDTQGYLICVSLCTTDFCNGPKAEAPGLTIPFVLQAMCLLSIYRWLN